MATRKRRCTRQSSKQLEMKEVPKAEDKQEPVATSSPNFNRSLDSEDSEIIKMMKGKLEDLKKNVSKHARLTKFKLGTEYLKMSFNKALFTKIIEVLPQKEMSNKSVTLTGLSTLSFTNAASSTLHQLSRNQDKNTLYETRNRQLNNSQRLKTRENVQKEVTFRETTFELRDRNKILDGKQSDVSKTLKRTRDISNNSTFRTQSHKRMGGRAVAVVTPGPDVYKPLSVLRRPTAGELAVSLYGSPLLVAPNYAPTSMPQINLPTADGKVVSILPREGFNVEDMPIIATPTRYQLKTLNKYLNDLCHQHEKM